MAFGQAAGPPASGRQLEELAALLERAGYASFREARHPFGLNQRQAGGRFTVTEAGELIERLTAAEVVQQSAADPAPTVEQLPDEHAAPMQAGGSATRAPSVRRPRSAASLEAERRRDERRSQLVGSLTDDVMVAELERRGWCCIPPALDAI
jgi:hypothetical protein